MSRSEGGALTYAEILAWATLTGERPAPWEVRALRAVEREYIRCQNERTKAAAGKTGGG